MGLWSFLAERSVSCMAVRSASMWVRLFPSSLWLPERNPLRNNVRSVISALGEASKLGHDVGGSTIDSFTRNRSIVGPDLARRQRCEHGSHDI